MPFRKRPARKRPAPKSRWTATRRNAALAAKGSKPVVSAHEEAFAVQFARAYPNYSQPEREYKFHATRRWRFDFAWPDYRIAVEIQGGLWRGGRHTRGAALLKEYEKLNTAAADGWRVLLLAPEHLQTDEAMKWTAAALGFAWPPADAARLQPSVAPAVEQDDRDSSDFHEAEFG